MSFFKEIRAGAPTLLGSTLALGMGVTALNLYSGGLFFRPLEHAIGLTRTDLGLGVFLSTLGIAVANPVVGQAVDRWGPRRPGLFAFAALAVLYLASGTVMHSVGVYLTLQFLLGLLAAGSGPITFVRAVSGWFVKGRGLALGVLLTGIGLSAAIAPPQLSAIIAKQGWEAGFRTLAAIAAVGLVPVALFVRLPDAQAAARAPTPLPAALSTPERRAFGMLLAAFAIMAVSFAGMMSHFAPMMSDFGASPARIGALMGVIGTSITLSRPLIGWLIDRCFAPYIAAGICMVCLGAFIALWVGGEKAATLSGMAFGAGMGAEADLLGYLVTRYFGLARFGRLYGWQYAAFIVSAGTSPLWMGLSFDHTGSYHLTFLVAATLLAVAAALFLCLPAYDRLPGASAPPQAGGGYNTAASRSQNATARGSST